MYITNAYAVTWLIPEAIKVCHVNEMLGEF